MITPRAVALATASILLLAACGKGGGAATPSPPWPRTSNPSGRAESANAMAIDGTSLYVVGSDASPGATAAQWRIEKRAVADGALDAAFGADGVVTSTGGTGSGGAWAVALRGTSLYVAGYDVTGTDRSWRIERRAAGDGALDAAFGAGGVVTSDPSPGLDQLGGIALGADHLFVVGSDTLSGTAGWWIEKRALADGALDTGFGTAGVVTSDPSADWDWANAVALDADALYVLGIDRSNGAGDTQWRIEKRAQSDGALVAAFGAGGVVTSNPSTSFDWANALLVVGSSLYVAGTDRALAGTNVEWRVEKRSTADGTLDASFGTGGVVTRHLGSSTYGSVNAIATDGATLYVAGQDCLPGGADCSWRIDGLSLADGAAATGFGASGTVTSNPSAGNDGATAVVVGPSSLFVAGYDEAPGGGDAQWRVAAFPR